MRTQMLAAVLILGTAIPAIAADAVVEEVVVVDEAFNWTGGYVGAQVGYAWGDSTAYYFAYPDGLTDIDPDGWLGGVYIGYNYQLPNSIVLGAEADIVYADVHRRSHFYDGGIPSPDSFDSLDLNWSGAVRGRVGYAVGRFLPYFAAGVAFGDVDTAAEDGNPEFVDSWNETGHLRKPAFERRTRAYRLWVRYRGGLEGAIPAPALAF